MTYPHRPVMVREVLEHLVTERDGIYIDGTVGTAGHSEAIVKLLSEKGRLICLDRDLEAVEISKKRLSNWKERVAVYHANYGALKQVLRDAGIDKVQGVLLDLGMSSFQLDQSGRGFSFNRDEPLDMRMDRNSEITADHLINELPQEALVDILKTFGEEKRAKSIVRSIINERSKGPLKSSLQLANLIQSLYPLSGRPGARHPATKTFQALRIAVNREIDNLKDILDDAPSIIDKGGRLVVLSYHSLEDRIVKHTMAQWEKGCICPPDLPKCVSATLRATERI
ncbi:MAG: 16S rRNA (cytosine(1402)-N(4))-methyltransferase RsmH [Deltaproteobacteria bacterium]|nr:16S rRNA (cytosine(1402)-N(4))-methyltransferase RsmH [Deltaproteobacteria bacterium]